MSLAISHAESIQAELIRHMTPHRRLEIAQSLYRTAWEFKAAWLRTQNIGASEAEIQRLTRLVFVTGHAGA